MTAWYIIYKKLNSVTSGKYSVKPAGDTIQRSCVLSCRKNTKIFCCSTNILAKMASTKESVKRKWCNWRITMHRRDQLRAKQDRRH